jgi:predicted nucleic acid-binding protein
LLPWYTTWGILYEFFRVSIHPRVFKLPLSIDQAWRFIEVLLSSPGLRLLSERPNHTEIASKTFQEVLGLRGNLLHDAHTAILMREHAIKKNLHQRC